MSVLNNVELVMRGKSKGVDPPTVEEMRHALDAYQLATSHAEDIPMSTAFRRAADSLRQPAKEGTPGVSARVWKVEGGQRCQIDREVANGRLSRNVLAILDLIEDENHSYLDEPESGDREILDAMRTAYEECRIRYTWGDVTAIIRSVLQPNKGGAAGTYTLRDGVYCVPLIDPNCVHLLNRLENCIGFVKGALLRYQVPDTEAHRQEVRAAIQEDLYQSIDNHTESIVAYSERTEMRHITNRVESLNELRQLVERLQSVLGYTLMTQSLSRIDGLLNACQVAEEAAKMAQGNVRRIVSPTLFN